MLIKETKTKVMRITGSEERLLEYIRDEGMGVIEGISKRIASTDCEIGRGAEKLVALLTGTLGVKQNELRERIEMTDEQEELLYKYMRENRNIIIEGKTNIGKSTIINSLLREQEGVQVVVLDDRDGCIRVNKNEGNGTEVSYSGGITLGEMFNLAEILKTKPVRVVVDGIYSKEHSLGILESLNRGMSILVADYPGWEARIITELREMGISRASDILESRNMVKVVIGRTEDNKNTIVSIEG